MTAAPAVMGKCECGGTRVHHSIETECWCQNCLARDPDGRCAGFRPVMTPVGTSPAIDRQVTRTGASHPRTAQNAGNEVLYRSGTLRRLMYDLLEHRGLSGHTDDELEAYFQRSHQTISSARNTLSSDGFIIDSGKRRTTRTGHDAIVWVLAKLVQERPLEIVPEAVQPLLFDEEKTVEPPPAEPPAAIRRVAQILAKKHGGSWVAHTELAWAISKALRSYDTAQLAGNG